MILSGPIAPAAIRTPALLTPEEEIGAMIERLSAMPQVEMPLTHRFSPGIYLREILMPAGTFVIGHKHKTRHFNTVLTGKARVMMNGEIQDIEAPCVFESGEGVQKILLIEEDMRWITTHANPTDCTDVVAIEESLVELSTELLARKGAMDLDTLRRSVNSQHQLKEQTL